MVAVQVEEARSSRAKSRGAGNESEQRASTTLGTNEVVGRLWRVLQGVPDPEIPVLSVVDLGIVREVTPERVTITPTYTGCPATQVIERDIRDALDAAGYREVRIDTTLSPPWSTDWISEEGKAKLKAYGIAPPTPAGTRAVECPQCGSTDTEELSRFGSTPCKAQWRCRSCLEPFDLFKCH
ncbi:1,2-phenylacetyl-CoA epoxidase subunit PaaD [Sphingosinicella humi]|uniref:Phenylacetate-CoA oxygenase subunit PaaJ n=1 Tax=Allosphingosinicella humi TaxID=2068657 RepID=A0A2U2IZI2_9SPHN|nr:1,2-phenylacetyl-CoA epoxidase subunit PaaD [Sphingosinicella humi]PWG01496.1 phenylacetate-CoA oxygenase subunit PaaJ [Sphingosinicella humi]